MKILIVEDDEFKLIAIKATIIATREAEIKVATSLRTAMTHLEEDLFDFVVLDMAIPSHTSEAGAVDMYSQPVGGLDVLLFLSESGREERVSILTQHPTIEYDRRHVPLRSMVRTLRDDGIRNVVGAILFTEAGDWKAQLLATLEAH